MSRRRRPTGRATLIAAATALAALAAGACATGGGPSSRTGDSTGDGAASATSAGTPGLSTGARQENAMRIQLTIGDQRATVTLEDNAAARDLASMLPLTVPMTDLFGREKPGPLPRPLAGDVEPVFTYRVGQLAYWPPDHNIFVVYDGDGAPVPRPGLIPLGTVDTGLDVIAGAGNDFELTITALA
jgi:hypothetical protein